MITVRQILKNKGKQVWSVTPDTSVYEALQVMAKRDIGALLVMQNERPVGVFSERDYARKCMDPMRSTKETAVSELMNAPVITVRPGQSIGACMTTMDNKHVRHLPVVENETVVGVISIGDVVRAMIAEQQQVINDLGTYLTGVK